MSKFISIDPGRDKCGLLIADLDLGTVIDAKVVRKPYLLELISNWRNSYKFERIILGNGTTTKYWEDKLLEFSPIHIVDEKGSTFRARFRYWELWPPNSFLFWIPRGLMIPPKNLDAVAALILLEDYLGRKLKWTKKQNFKIWP